MMRSVCFLCVFCVFLSRGSVDRGHRVGVESRGTSRPRVEVSRRGSIARARLSRVWCVF